MSDATSSWVLWRQEDGGARARVSEHATEAEARAALQSLEPSGHKQLYSVEASAPPASAPAPVATAPAPAAVATAPMHAEPQAERPAMTASTSAVSPAKRVTRLLKKEVAKELERPDWGLRLIIAWKVGKGTLLVTCALILWAVAPRTDLHDLAGHFVAAFHVNPTNEHVEHFISKITSMPPIRLREISAGALFFAAFMFVEAWGLHKRRVWAEWLTIIATCSLIPLEVYELYEKKSIGKLVALLVNILVVLYLARHRFLFLPGPVGRWLHAHFGSPDPHAPHPEKS